MSVKASITVTLSCYRDTQSITRYYKLQSSTIAKPAKPTVNPPTDWVDTEPSYTSGSTNTLYFCDLNVFSDGTWAYSSVSKSSSYEAAKEAYNRAVAAGTAATDAQNGVNDANQAIEDLSNTTSERITNAEATIEQLADSISMLVQDENGASLMEQTSTGWVFSMGEVLSQLRQAHDDLETLEANVDERTGDIISIQKAVTALEEIGNYIRITTDGNEPCIELGNEGSFKVKITNTNIQFIDGTTVPAHISNETLQIGKATVEDELSFGSFAFKERANGNMGLIWKG